MDSELPKSVVDLVEDGGDIERTLAGIESAMGLDVTCCTIDEVCH